MLLAQITDPHVKANRQLAYGRVDTAALLDSAIQHINAFTPSIDAVIVSGDLTDRGRVEEFAAIRPILDGLAMPWYVVPGNHDQRENFIKAFADHDYLADCADFVQYAVEGYPLRLVGLDTSVAGQPHGFLSRDRLTWLDRCLQDEPRKPTLLFMHHPPFITGIGHMDVQNLLNAQDLFEILDRHAQVRHVACGHVHRASETCINGIALSIAPNSAHAVTLDMEPDGPSTFTMDPPAVRLLRYGDDGNVVTHLSFIGTFDGPHPFFAADGSLVD
ncbi:MAG: phosphodiesterase [Rhodospirillales bacterium]|nr:phosphodiesterase [Rhodospirillales bacterium]